MRDSRTHPFRLIIDFDRIDLIHVLSIAGEDADMDSLDQFREEASPSKTFNVCFRALLSCIVRGLLVRVVSARVPAHCPRAALEQKATDVAENKIINLDVDLNEQA